jgi:hypothetical protein
MSNPEYDKLMNDIKDKSESTKKNYRLQYNKLYKLIQENDNPLYIKDVSQDKIIKLAKQEKTTNSQQALLNIAIVVKKDNKKDNKKLIDLRDKNRTQLVGETKEKNIILSENLPEYEELIEYLEHLYDRSDWIDYIINYLLIHFNVRNKDLVFDIVTRKKDVNLKDQDDEKNYIWLSKDKAVYYRKDYKTAWKYGRKENVIKDKKLLMALRRVFACQKHNESCGVFIPTLSQADYYIKKATYKNLGEGKYFKIAVKHFKNDLQKLKEMSESRGTSIDTISNFYDVSKQ